MNQGSSRVSGASGFKIAFLTKVMFDLCVLVFAQSISTFTAEFFNKNFVAFCDSQWNTI